MINDISNPKTLNTNYCSIHFGNFRFIWMSPHRNVSSESFWIFALKSKILEFNRKISLEIVRKFFGAPIIMLYFNDNYGHLPNTVIGNQLEAIIHFGF